MKICPFLVSLPNQELFTISLLWPIVDIEESEMIYRDYLSGIESPSLRRLYSLAYSYPEQLEKVNFQLEYHDIIGEAINTETLALAQRIQSSALVVETPSSWESIFQSLQEKIQSNLVRGV